MTAYGVRISDWSSDVCSSALSDVVVRLTASAIFDHGIPAQVAQIALGPLVDLFLQQLLFDLLEVRCRRRLRHVAAAKDQDADAFVRGTEGLRRLADLQADERRLERCGQRAHFDIVARHDRSEEHTSELQSLMRISYAVFCLKKKKT